MVLYTLSVGLLRAFIDYLLVSPCSLATAHLGEAFGGSERKPRKKAQIVEINTAASKGQLKLKNVYSDSF